MQNKELFIYLIFILMIIVVSCFLCNKNMSNNRGNFVNLPAWRKATKSVFDIVLSLITILVLVYYKLFNHLIVSLIIPLIICIIIAIIYFIINKYSKMKKPKNNILESGDLFSKVWEINITVIEYVVYCVRYVSKFIAFLLITFIGSYQINVNVFETELPTENSYLQRVLSLISNVATIDLSIYVLGLCCFSVFYSAIFMIILSITLTKDDSSSLDHKQYLSVCRKFSFNEHSI